MGTSRSTKHMSGHYGDSIIPEVSLASSALPFPEKADVAPRLFDIRVRGGHGTDGIGGVVVCVLGGGVQGSRAPKKG